MTNVWVKDPFKKQDGAIAFNVAKHTFSDMVSDSTLHLTFMKLPLVKCWRSIKEYPQLYKNSIQIFFFLNYIFEKLSLYCSTKTSYQNADSDVRIHLNIHLLSWILKKCEKRKTNIVLLISIFVLVIITTFHKNILFTLIFNVMLYINFNMLIYANILFILIYYYF